jgi:hypothetical protein
MIAWCEVVRNQFHLFESSCERVEDKCREGTTCQKVHTVSTETGTKKSPISLRMTESPRIALHPIVIDQNDYSTKASFKTFTDCLYADNFLRM